MIKFTVGTTEPKPSVPEFPFIAKHVTAELYLLVRSAGNGPGYLTGTVIYSDNPIWDIGQYTDCWNVDVFKRYDKPITLENVK